MPFIAKHFGYTLSRFAADPKESRYVNKDQHSSIIFENFYNFPPRSKNTYIISNSLKQSVKINCNGKKDLETLTIGFLSSNTYIRRRYVSRMYIIALFPAL